MSISSNEFQTKLLFFIQFGYTHIIMALMFWQLLAAAIFLINSAYLDERLNRISARGVVGSDLKDTLKLI